MKFQHTPPDSKNDSQLILNGIYKSFIAQTHEVTALENVSFSIREGEFLCLVGPSGCGKSTLLNLIAGLDIPDKGTILIDGQPITGPGSDRMMMFQESALFPWLNVWDNVLFGLKLKPSLSHEERKEQADYYLKLVNLEKFRFSSIHELSGGMKQRVALARALAPKPQMLLMDEPFASLDALTREQLYEDLQEIWKSQSKTIVFVTHNVSEAVCLGDRVILLASNPGRIQQEFQINLPRPRDIRSVKVAQCASEITSVLKNQTH